MFAASAKRDGRVVSVDTDVIVVEYSDGVKHHIQVGTRFGNAEGKVYPHEIIANVAVGDELKEGDLIAYNKGFFEPRPGSGKQASFKFGLLLRTVYMEDNVTFEDSCSISRARTPDLHSKVTKVHTITPSFDDAIYELIRPGTPVEVDSILCVREEKSGDVSLFGESVDDLKQLSKRHPKSDYRGVVEKVEVFYYGSIEDMDPTLKSLARAENRRIKELYGKLGKSTTTAEVDASMRVDGKSVKPNTMIIRVYVTVEDDVKSGDKFVVSSQLKTTAARKHSEETITTDGRPVELIFGAASDNDRIVESSKEIMLGNTLAVLWTEGFLDLLN